MDLAETYDRIAEAWHEDHSHDDWWKEGTETFMRELGPGKHVLDVGCGGGTKSKYLIEHGYRVTGIDVSKNLLAIARRTAPKGEYRLLSMYDLDSLPGSFDAVFAQASLLHIPKKDAGLVIQKMADKAVPGGLVYIAVKERREGEPDEEIVSEDDYGYTYERFFSYYTLEELEMHLKEAGLTLLWNNRKLSGNSVWLQIIGAKR